MKSETWKEIKGYPGYEVSNLGNIRSYRNNRWGLSETPRLLSIYKGNRGYLTVSLGRNNPKLIHKLVAEAFIPNPNNYPIVLHNDSNRSNPRWDNLHWGTHSENTFQGVEEGTVDTAKARRARLEACVTYVFTSPSGETVIVKNLSEFARKHNLSTGNLSSVVQGKRTHTRGWKCLVCNLPKRVETQ